LTALIAVPLLLPLIALAGDGSAWEVWSEAHRIGTLAKNSLLLVAGTVLLALPIGTVTAVLLYRTDLPLRRAFRFLTVLTLLVPLPLFTSGWQAAVGSGGWLPLAVWNTPRAQELFGGGGAAWMPWGQGIGSVVWIHAVAALPWVILLVGQGLLGVERSLEEEALTLLPAWRVVLAVSLPQASLMIAAAALWVSVQAATEITVTDVMQVRTFAEEVYTQLAGPEAAPNTGGSPVTRAVAAAVPSVLLLAALLLLLATWWERRQSVAVADPAPPQTFGLGRWRWPLAVLGILLSVLLVGVPVGSLIWCAGLTGAPRQWSAITVLQHLGTVTVVDGQRLGGSLATTTAAGMACAALALLTAWAAVGSWWFRGGMLVLAALAWALPGPIVGLGLKDLIPVLRDRSDWLAAALYFGPSPAPHLWIDLLRFFPFALALLWPAVRQLPPELREGARVECAGPGRELWHVVRPLTVSAFWRTVLAVGVLSLGELSAGKLVSTPGMQSFAETIFTKMHYGVTNDLAASCLLLLALVTTGAILLSALFPEQSLLRAGPPARRVERSEPLPP
jgi:iron(III) transport system permease protein